MKNRRGIGIEWYLLIVAFILGLAGYYVYLYTSPHNIIDSYIGKYQFNILKTHNMAEDIFLYIDQSSKYSLQQSIYELGKSGGNLKIEFEEAPASDYASEDIGCGKFYGYAIWYQLKEGNINSCINEESRKTSLEYSFNKELNRYLLNYPYNIPIDNYDYEIKGNLEIVGKAIEPLRFEILKDEGKKAVKESVKTSEGLIDFTGTEFCAKGAVCLLTGEAFEKLKKAQQRAKEKGVSLEVYGSYRSREQLIQEWERGRFSYIKDEKIRRKYVCYPYGDDVENRCPHATGKAVDVRVKGKDDLILLKKIMTDDKLEDRWIRYARENEEHHFECCGTARYARAKELEEKTGQSVIEIV